MHSIYIFIYIYICEATLLKSWRDRIEISRRKLKGYSVLVEVDDWLKKQPIRKAMSHSFAQQTHLSISSHVSLSQIYRNVIIWTKHATTHTFWISTRCQVCSGQFWLLNSKCWEDALRMSRVWTVSWENLSWISQWTETDSSLMSTFLYLRYEKASFTDPLK